LTTSKFALRSFDGTPTRHFLVESVSADTSGTPNSIPSHHVVIVDASGSMYYDMKSMASLIQKVWTLSEFADSDQLVSLYSYSGTGDLREHFARISIADVMAADSTYLAEISGLRTRGLTCISQALEALPDLVRSGEITAVSLHSDGYANAPSPTKERMKIRQVLKQLANIPEIFINTIAHRASSDFTLLNEIANAVSGVCVRAPNIRQVYEALYNTTALLASNTAPVLSRPLGDDEYQTFVSVSSGKYLGAAGDLSVRGLSAGDDATFYSYTYLTPEEYDSYSVPVCGVDASSVPVYAYAYAQIAEGNLNQAKYALVSTRDLGIYENHLTALVGEDVAALAEAVKVGIQSQTDKVPTYGLDTGRSSVLSILSTLSDYAGKWSLSLPDFYANYKRRTVARVAGKLDQDTGEVIAPSTDTVYRDDGKLGLVTSVKVNQTGANVNLTVTRPVSLVWRDSREVITRHAGVDLTNLTQPKSYTVVGDGRLTITKLPIQVHDKRLWKALGQLGLVTGAYQATSTIMIDLTQRPMVEYSQKFDATSLQGVFTDVAEYKILTSILNAVKGRTRSESMSADTVAALADICLTPALNISFPTMNPYADRDKALHDGSLDTRIAYSVSLGTDQLTDWGSLSSANKELDRRFVATGADGKKISKPKMDQVFWDASITVAEKPLTKRTKLTQVDELTFPIMSSFFRLEDFSILRAGLSSDLIEDFEEAVYRQMDDDETVETFNKVLSALKTAQNRTLQEMWIPVVFYIGTTGLVPDGYLTSANTAEEIKKRYPSLKIGSKFKDNTFFPVDDTTIISVGMSEVYYSTMKEREND